MFATRFEKCLINIQEMLGPELMYYMPREEAYEKLKEISGQDFGFDCKAWERWGRANGHILYYSSGDDDGKA